MNKSRPKIEKSKNNSGRVVDTNFDLRKSTIHDNSEQENPSMFKVARRSNHNEIINTLAKNTLFANSTQEITLSKKFKEPV